MGVFSEAIEEEFEKYAETGDVFRFASDMVDIGDRCRWQWHADYVHNALFTKRDKLLPKHIPKSQMMKYIEIKIKKEKGGK